MTPITIVPHESPNQLREYAEAMVAYLETLRGKGEIAGRANNSSPFIRMLRSTDGTGGKIDTGGAWCAVTVSHAGVKVAIDRGCEIPFKASRGARKVTKNVAAVGRWIVPPGDTERILLIPRGSLVCWRGTGWRGHVSLAVDYDLNEDTLTIIEGNKNNRVGVNGKKYAVIDYREILRGRWRAKLFGVASLW